MKLEKLKLKDSQEIQSGLKVTNCMKVTVKN